MRGFEPQRIAMQLHDNHKTMQETKAKGRKTTMPIPQNGARHRAKIRIARRELLLGVESDDKWWILAMVAPWCLVFWRQPIC